MGYLTHAALCLGKSEIFLVGEIFLLLKYFASSVKHLSKYCKFELFWLHRNRVIFLDVEDSSEEMLSQQSYAIKNQLVHPKPLVLYGIRDGWIPCIERIYYRRPF